jgi:hypothetical protein
LWLDYEHLRLTVERVRGGWQVFVYDRIAHLVLYQAKRMTVHGAKVAGVEFSLIHLGDPEHRQDPERITESLRWKPIGGAAIQ